MLRSSLFDDFIILIVTFLYGSYVIAEHGDGSVICVFRISVTYLLKNAVISPTNAISVVLFISTYFLHFAALI